jgi:hypothetical protein
VTARERVDLPAVDLFASIGRPVASGLKASGTVESRGTKATSSGRTPSLVRICVGAVQPEFGLGVDLKRPVWRSTGKRLATRKKAGNSLEKWAAAYATFQPR